MKPCFATKSVTSAWAPALKTFTFHSKRRNVTMGRYEASPLMIHRELDLATGLRCAGGLVPMQGARYSFHYIGNKRQHQFRF